MGNKFQDRWPSKANLLFVEDDIDLLTHVSKVFEKIGHTVYPAVSGKDAIEQFAKNKDDIDIIVTDMSIPEISSIEMLKEFNRLNMKMIPVIVVTAHNVLKPLLEKLECIEKIHIKPFDPSDVLDDIQEIMNNGKCVKEVSDEDRLMTELIKKHIEVFLQKFDMELLQEEFYWLY